MVIKLTMDTNNIIENKSIKIYLLYESYEKSDEE